MPLVLLFPSWPGCTEFRTSTLGASLKTKSGKMRCARCDYKRMDVERTCRDTAESVLRQRKCPECGHRVFTVEVELPDGAAQHTRTGVLKRLPGFLRVRFF